MVTNIGRAPEPIFLPRRPRKIITHHGGSWKVAYADFTTALMSLFIVLWLLNGKADVRQAIGGYFADPGHQAPANDELSELKGQITRAIDQAPELRNLQGQVEMVVTTEGLRIELLESDKDAFFENGRPRPTPLGREMIELLAKQLGRLPNHLMIEGHTDAKPLVSDRGYTNWELSSDRANSARQLMSASGLSPDQVTQVRGFASQKLRNPNEPENYANRRITVIVQAARSAHGAI